ncbi:hypothetical protein [Sphingobacterium sp. LRF_L2]|uniref:hypothetical protein n=1 Tax=Sphingobacterium sp. LRF_L2 TaxID=3369421 RepID=UPI003F5FC588
MKRREFITWSTILGAAASFRISSAEAKQYTDSYVNIMLPKLENLRRLSSAIVGDLPIRVNVIKVADTIRPASVVVKGEDPFRNMTLARTVYQLEFRKGSILLDTGMDLETHRTFGKTEEPYYPENYEMVQKAMLSANMIVLTHYHADHVGGIVRTSHFADVASKVWLTRDTAQLMVNKPHKPTVSISQENVSRFNVVDFDTCYPLAPGVVILKTPGHTVDSKSLYFKLEDGREFIHSVDSGWSMENIRSQRMKNASWVNENEFQLLAQYKWLNRLMYENKDLIVLCTHDNEQYNTLIENGILGGGLKT